MASSLMSSKKGFKKSTSQQAAAAAAPQDAFATSRKRTVVQALLLLAMVSAVYLLHASLSGGAVAGCGPDSGCDRVLRSRWAYWFGVPVSAPALLAYASLFVLTTLYPRQTQKRRQQLWPWMFGLSIMVVGAATWFVALMAFAIKGFCPFCLAAHGSAVAAAILFMTSVPMGEEPKPQHKKQIQPQIAPALVKRATAAGLAGVLLLAGGQLAYKKPGHIIKSLEAPQTMAAGASNTMPPTLPPAAPPITVTQKVLATNVETAKQSPPVTSPAPSSSTNPPALATATPSAGRVITTHQGAFQFNLNDVPLFGSPEAPYVIVSLFDYTCHHCHIMHAHLQTALQYFSNRLAIISLPMPLDSQCNPLIRRTHPTASNACVYARLGLAVWRADRKKFQQFDQFMFSRPVPPPVSEASDYAANLVGANTLGRALADPWVEERLRQNISLYHTNALILQSGAMPQLILGNKAVSGSLNSPGELIRLLNEHLFKP